MYHDTNLKKFLFLSTWFVHVLVYLHMRCGWPVCVGNPPSRTNSMFGKWGHCLMLMSGWFLSCKNIIRILMWLLKCMVKMCWLRPITHVLHSSHPSFNSIISSLCVISSSFFAALLFFVLHCFWAHLAIQESLIDCPKFTPRFSSFPLSRFLLPFSKTLLYSFTLFSHFVQFLTLLWQFSDLFHCSQPGI